MNREQFFGAVVVISGPSGVGKSTVCRSYENCNHNTHFSVSCTTRPRRHDEIDGQAYHFINEKEYNVHLENGDFLEHAEVHSFLYGTLAKELDEVMEGNDVILDIDVQGMRQVKKALASREFFAPRLVTVFIMPPSMEELERRLRGRKTETEEAVERRLNNAKKEIAAWREFDYVLVNESSMDTAEHLARIVSSVHFRTSIITEETWNNGYKQ